MSKELLSLADRIKSLRESAGLTQAEIARILGISRSGVNAWEMGISIPSTQCVVELANFFNVSTDYILGVSSSSAISVEGLSDREVASVLEIIECYRAKNSSAENI